MTWTILSLQNVRLDSPPHPLRLVHLPTDALIAILTKLDPPDILSVRAVRNPSKLNVSDQYPQLLI